MNKPRPDIFPLLAAIDRGDGGWLSRQSDADQKTFSPVTYLRWASSIDDSRKAAIMLETLNVVVNRGMFAMQRDHPELVFRLAALCGTGTRQRHTWPGMPRRRNDSNAARMLLARHHPEANDRELDMLMRLHTRASFAAFVDETAIPDAEAKEVMKAYASYRKDRLPA